MTRPRSMIFTLYGDYIYRTFPFSDPQLPRELLPDGWVGSEAVDLFHVDHALRGERAHRVADAVFERSSGMERAAASEANRINIVSRS